jgi:hypothetical protein
MNHKKTHIEFYFKETSFNKWENDINLKMVFGQNNDLNVLGGNIKYNFVYDSSASLLGYNNIIIIK